MVATRQAPCKRFILRKFQRRFLSLAQENAIKNRATPINIFLRRIMMDVSKAILTRKSIRAYLDKPVPAEDLEKIIEAGQWAPNAGEFRISAIRNNELLKRINDATHDKMVNSGIEFLQQRVSLPGYQTALWRADADPSFRPHRCAVQRGQCIIGCGEHAPPGNRNGPGVVLSCFPPPWR